MVDDTQDATGEVVHPRTPDDKSNIDLSDWYQNQTQSPEARLISILEEAGIILERLKGLDSRHEQALSDLESRIAVWTTLEAGLRVRTRALDQLHESAAHSVVGLQHAGSRFKPHESQGLTQGAGPVDDEGVPQAPRPAPSGEPWQLEGVLQLHDELRRSEGALPPAREEPPQLLLDRVESLELAAVVGKEELQRTVDRYTSQRRRTSFAIAVLALGLVAATLLALGWKRAVDAQLSEASARLTEAQRVAQSAAQEAEQQIASAKQAAEQQIAEAQQTARRAQIVSDVLAAPDLVRLSLPGSRRAPQASAQLLWSQSRGFVLSGSRLPTPREGTQHQLWLLTRARPVAAGSFAVDVQGRVMWVNDASPRVSQGIVGAAVTSEQAGTNVPRRSEATLRGRSLAISPQPDPDANAPEGSATNPSGVAVQGDANLVGR